MASIQAHVTVILNSIQAESFAKTFQNIYDQCHKCVAREEILWANTAKANSKNTGVSLNSPKEILGAKVVSGKFGTQVLLELEKSVVFLPKRTTTVLEPHIDELKGNYIIFEGIRKFNNHEQVYFNFLHPWETSELEKGNVH
ncbi:hypothetical protein ABEB36_015204 [Hypothenemus hampei]|uniref:Uncharacterized protein n=1 Tax=Hypothenemus hampei TaxID=57062 RepID=A0ABD1E102_HYPHA